MAPAESQRNSAYLQTLFVAPWFTAGFWLRTTESAAASAAWRSSFDFDMLAAGGEAADKAAAALVGKFITGANVVASLISMVAEVTSAEINVHVQEPVLKRNKKRSDGEGGPGQMTVEVFYDFPKLDQDNPTVCALSAVANALGVGFTMPTHRAPLSGAELVVAPGKHVPAKVLIDTDSMKYTLDSNGMAEVKVKGAQQPKDLPDSAKEFQDEFGLNFSAQPEAETVQSLLNMFLDSVSLSASVIGADPQGVLGAGTAVVLDVAKTLHYTFDEQIFAFTDYKSSYTVTGNAGPIQFSGTVDDIDKPFTLKVSGGPTVPDTALFDPTDGKIVGLQAKIGTTVTMQGNYTLTETSSGYTGSGKVQTCIVISNCSPNGDLHLTFTPQS